MSRILDKFQKPTFGFAPRTGQEVFALRLARKLDEAAAASHYAMLVGQYSEASLLIAYRRTIRCAEGGDLGRRFHAELQRVAANGGGNGSVSLLALRVERRAIAAAVFHGDQLEYTDSRQLSSSHDKALASAVGFIHWLLARFPVESAAIESIVGGGKFQRRVLHESVCRILREGLLPIWEIPRVAQLEGFGYPALKTRPQLRGVATAIWPILQEGRTKLLIQDAALLGLHVQIERLFMIN